MVRQNFIVPGSCPSDNPIFPTPDQNLPGLGFNTNTSTAHPGEPITFIFIQPDNQPSFEDDKDYYAVFVHALTNVTVPFDPKNPTVIVPDVFEKGKGIDIAVIADTPGAPTMESVVAGPLILVQQPAALTEVGA